MVVIRCDSFYSVRVFQRALNSLAASEPASPTSGWSSLILLPSSSCRRRTFSSLRLHARSDPRRSCLFEESALPRSFEFPRTALLRSREIQTGLSLSSAAQYLHPTRYPGSRVAYDGF